MNRFHPAFLAAAGLSLFALLAAQAAPPPADDARCELRVATGPKGKVYEQLFADMRSVCGAEVALCAVPSEGGLNNLTLLSSSQADVGLAQLDTVDTMKDGDDNVRRLQAVLPLHANLLHVLSLSAGSKVDTTMLLGRPVPGTGRMVQVRSFADLRGLRIAAVGSAQLMGRTLDSHWAYGMQFDNADSDEQALQMLRAGKVQAVFTTVGWPSPFVARLRDDTYTLVRYEQKPPPHYQVVKRNYQNLDALNHPFLAVPNLLLSPPYKAGGSYFKRVAALQRCLVKHLDVLQEGAFHPAWKEIGEHDRSFGLLLFPGAAAQAAAPTAAARRK